MKEMRRRIAWALVLMLLMTQCALGETITTDLSGGFLLTSGNASDDPVYDITVTVGTGLVYKQTPTYRWDPDDHSYETENGGTWENAAINVTVTSHSNVPVTVNLTYANTADAQWSDFTGSFSSAQLTFAAYDSSNEDAATQTATLTMSGDLSSFIAELVTGSPLTIGSVTAAIAGTDTTDTADVSAEFQDAGTVAPVYSVTITWGDMAFVYTDTTTYEWDVAAHTYTHTGNLTGTWTSGNEGGDLVTVTNHSNVTVSAALTYTPAAAYSGFNGSLTKVSSSRASLTQSSDSAQIWTLENGLTGQYGSAATATARLILSGATDGFESGVIGELGLTLSVPEDAVVTPASGD